MRMKNSLKVKGKEEGIVLIEALISIFLFSLGILALVGMHAVMTKNVTHAKLRGEASFLANQLIGQMWADQTNLTNYVVADGACSRNNVSCNRWAASVTQMLPSGSADVTVNGNTVNIALSWSMEGEVPGNYTISADINN